MSRKPLGDKAMTAAERQRRRRAKLRSETPPQKSGRPRLHWLEKSTHEMFCEALKDERWKARSSRRYQSGKQYANFGEQALGIEPRFEKNYSAENVERFKPLMRKGILEQLGRHAVFMANIVGCSPDQAVVDVRELAEDLLIDHRNGELSVENVTEFFRWLREPERPAVTDNAALATTSITGKPQS